MPYGSWIDDLPTAFFMVVHIGTNHDVCTLHRQDLDGEAVVT